MSSKFEFNLSGLREVMKSPEMESALESAGQAAAGSTGNPDYKTDTHQAPFTAVCTVYPSTREAGLDNYLHNTLLKAVQSVGLKL